MKLPNLLLQPIVENAIKFGLYDTTGETLIRIQASDEENNLLLKVENPFDPETSVSSQYRIWTKISAKKIIFIIWQK